MIAITGATGFIGRHLVESLIESKSGEELRVLTRQSELALKQDGLIVVQGDILDPFVWDRLLEPGCTLINLAYPHSLSEERAHGLAISMVEACARIGVRRLIHCSTVSVFGRVRQNLISETTVCNPVDDYGRIKFALEAELASRACARIDLAIIRPTVVFGSGGQSLVKMISDLLHGNRWVNYARSMLFGYRRTHLVPVETVVSAIRYLCDSESRFDSEIFIVSNDGNPTNNFSDVQNIVARQLGLTPLNPPIFLPRVVLGFLLRLTGRTNSNTQISYCGDKLAAMGFRQPDILEPMLINFVKWYKANLGLNRSEPATEIDG